MITPTALKTYLQERKQASLGDLLIHFDTDVETVLAAMSFWLRKGKVVESKATGCEKGCCQCDPLITTLFQWKE